MAESSTQDAPVEIELGTAPTASVIWLHGLGADGNDFVPIVPELGLPADANIRFIFPHAPHRPVTCNGGYEMRAWYDIFSLESMQRQDEPGLEQSRAQIQQLIEQEIQRGIPAARIVLMGFSQGGALALYAGLQYPHRLAGIGALSTYLPLQEKISTAIHPANADVSVFMAHGVDDPVVSYRLGRESRDTLLGLNLNLQWHEYPMQHSVCMEEIEDISRWLKDRLAIAA